MKSNIWMFLLLSCIIFVHCIYYNDPRVCYEDIQGIWEMDSISFISDSGIVKEYSKYINFNGDSVSTQNWEGCVFMIGEACERSAAYGKEVVNIRWQDGTSHEAYLSLEQMRGGDTLIIGVCVSVNCYVTQYANALECYSMMDTIIRTEQTIINH